MLSHEALGIIAVLVGLIGSSFYFIGILKRQIKPHAFTWGVWCLLSVIALLAQLTDNPGPGAWITAYAALETGLITLLALYFGDKKDIARSDWICLITAISIIPVWLLTSNPLYAILFVILIDYISFYPSFRKGFYKPNEDGVLTFFFGAIKFIIGFFALTEVTWVTGLYPLALAFVNFIFIAMILIRRKMIANAP